MYDNHEALISNLLIIITFWNSPCGASSQQITFQDYLLLGIFSQRS